MRKGQQAFVLVTIDENERTHRTPHEHFLTFHDGMDALSKMPGEWNEFYFDKTVNLDMPWMVGKGNVYLCQSLVF